MQDRQARYPHSNLCRRSLHRLFGRWILVKFQSRQLQSGWEKGQCSCATLTVAWLCHKRATQRLLCGSFELSFSRSSKPRSARQRGFLMAVKANQAPIQRQEKRRGFTLRRLAPVAGLLLILAAWQIITMLQIYPTFIIPTPISVVKRWFEVAQDGRLWLHTWTTVWQMLVGLSIGLGVGVLLGYLMAKSRTLEDVLSPVVLAFQSTPVVAYAPLLVIWFGSGPTSKIITSALIVFFPMLLNTIVGLRTVPPSLRDLMQSLRATRWQMFSRLEVPAALPVLFGGLKVSAVLAVIGVVVGEFISNNDGLGYLLNRARFDYDTPLVFVAILMLALIARVMYGIVSLLEQRALAWQNRSVRK